jgi:hypothetical protein
MQATRVRFVSFLEWIVAAGVVAAVVALGSIVAREIRTVNPVTPVIAGESRPDAPVPAGVPSRAVSVPMLLLPERLVVRVGDRLDAIVARLAGASEIRPPTVEWGASGERMTRFYEYAGTRFVLVFEPFERKGAPRIAAIYLQ